MDTSAVVFRGLTKRFGETLAVAPLDLEIPSGSFFGIVGPNGAGKTTLLRMTTGLLKPDAGTVAVAGVEVWPDPSAAKAVFGVVPDNPRMFERLTGSELIEMIGRLRSLPGPVIEQRRGSLLRLLDLTEAADVLVADYSLGMKKKLAIGAALLHDPRVLLLDEPFAGVDPVARQVLEQILRHHTRSGGTVIFSDHAMDVVERLCDHLLLIDRGSVVLSGATTDITGGRRLQDVFVETVGAHVTEEGDLDWLGSSSH